MAELTPIDEKLAEVLGLAQASQDTVSKVIKLCQEEDEDQQIVDTLERMRDEARETQERCEAIADGLDGKKTAVLDKGRETKQEASQMRDDYLGDDADALDGLEFMIMAEAGELGHVEIVGAMAQQVGDQQLQELAGWAQPIQQRHYDDTRKCALQLAREEASE
jgi:hypothetical protein